MAVLDRLDREYGFSKKERLLFQTIVRTQFFVAFGFQMLADDNLTTDEWKKMRNYAKEKADYLAKQSLTDFR
jgi:N-acetylglutamate synthase-like GNAT family acetyltransferase